MVSKFGEGKKFNIDEIEKPVTETAAESQEGEKKSLKEIGQEKRAATMEKGKKMWEGIKGGFSRGISSLKEKATNVVDYAFAAPEAINRGAQAVNQVGEKAGHFAVGKAVEAGEFVAEKARDAKTKVENGVSLVVDKAQEGYDTLSQKGQQTYENFKGRVGAAKDKWNDYRNRKQLELLNTQESEMQGGVSSKEQRRDALEAEIKAGQDRIAEIRRKKAEIAAKIRGASGMNPATAQAI